MAGMFEVLQEKIKSVIQISDDEMNRVKANHKPKKVKKGQFLLHEGQVCKETFYIVKGCLRLYRINEDGEEHVLKFAVEDWWINDSESFKTQTPSKSYIEAIEDSDIIAFDKIVFYDLLDTITSFRKFVEELTTRSFLATQERVYEQISLGAEVRYRNFLTAYPNISNRVPLHMIASYLGVSRKTLTRIRSQN